MRIKTVIKSVIISTLFIYVVLIAGKVYSETFDTSGNASGSNNSININQKDSNTVNQSNSADINNSVNATSDTGGNSINDGVGGGSITTGDASTKVDIKNEFNKNIGGVDCKGKKCPTPTPKPSPKVSPTITPVAPTATVTPTPPGKNGVDGKDGNGEAARVGEAPAVLGLADASGEKTALHILPGVLSIAFGFKLLRNRA